MNTERNPHLLNDPNGGGGGCVIGSSTSGSIHGYGSPPGNHGGGGGVDMAGVGQPCPVPTPPWVKPPSNNGNSGMMTPESDVSSCSSPASTSYGASSTSSQQFPSQQQQQHLPSHHHLQQQQHHQRSFYGSTSYSNCGGGSNSTNSGGSNNDPITGVHTTTMNQLRNHSSYCSSANSNSNAISSSTNNNGMFYDSAEVIDQNQYYHQHHQQQQHHHSNSHHHHHHHTQHFHHQTQFDNSMHLQKTGSSSSSCTSLVVENTVNLTGECVGGGGGDAPPGSGGETNFYGFYNQSGQYTTGDYHQQHHHTHHESGYAPSPADGNAGGGNRMHHQYYRQDGSSGNTSATSVPVGHPNYFNGSVPTPNPNYPPSPAGGVASGTSTPPTIMPTRYGSPMMFPNNHGHQLCSAANNASSTSYSAQQQQGHLGQLPIRRNSIESYSSEPGDMHSSYTARYGCSSTTNPTHPQLQQINPTPTSHHTNNNNAFSTSGTNPSGMIKRECMSTGNSGGMTSRSPPSINPMTPNSNPTSSGWASPHAPPPSGAGGYFPSSSPNNCASSSGSPNSCPSNSNPSRTNYLPNSFSSSNLCGGGGGESGECGESNGNFYSQQHHSQHQHPTTHFKSCAYEQSQQHHDIKEGIPTLVGNSGTNSSSMKAASAVKHRSLSLSMPLPSYLETSGQARSDLDTGTFPNHPHHHRQFQHHQHHHQSHHHQHGFNPMMDGGQQCTTTGQLVAPDQNLLTPNSDDDIPFRTASAGGQSDLDSSYETMGDEGCSSTSTSASHCMSMNTSGNSTCSGSTNSCDNNNGSSMTTPDIPDCHHHHHHHHHHHSDLSYTTPSSVSSCMQTHHAGLGMGMLEIPNSTVALCTTNVVDDLDDSSSDSSDELHNVISAVVENSSIETPENTMMGDEEDEGGNVVDDSQTGRPMDEHGPSESTDMNVISTTTNEPGDIDEDQVVDEDDNDNDNCSESSMSNINSSFTADMFCNTGSIDTGINTSGSELAVSNVKAGTSTINCSSFPCIPEEEEEEGNFVVDEDMEDDEDNASVNSTLSLQVLKSSSSTPSLTTSSVFSSSSSLSPQKIAKRSFSETDKDHVVVVNTTASSPLTSFGASFRKSCSSGLCEGDTTSISESSDTNMKNNQCGSNNNESGGSGGGNVDIFSGNSGGGSSSSSRVTPTHTARSGCKAIDIIISSSSGGSVSNANLIHANSNNPRVCIPKGWKREILKGTQSIDNETSGTGTGVLYISPSDTKIRNLDELKNYIGSDGTCKCGLSCPLRLEVAFSFDPKVTSVTVEDEKENLESLVTGRTDTSTSSSSSSSATAPTSNPTAESDSRLLCNHKRKIPKAEDSPLISSTRDDLGDFGEKLKKRRLSGNECLGEKLVSLGPFRKDPITTSASNNGSSSNNSSASNSVPVPFCQQSPDTTTQTPQTEMSPASSVCSDSSTILYSSAGGGNRSLTSTPTPSLASSSSASSSSTSSSSSSTCGTGGVAAASTTKVVASSPSQGQGHCEFVWPSPPTLSQPGNVLSSSTPPNQQSQSQPNTFWLNPQNSTATFTGSASLLGSSSNSLTLNYVQPPSSGSSVLSGIGKSATTAPISIAPAVSNSIPATTSATSLTTTISTTIATSTNTNASKKTYLPYPSKNVKRPSSPCPNIDVRQLPLEQNRPPPIPVTTSSMKLPIPMQGMTNTITNLQLPMVSNPNILFTVTPPQFVTANKTEIVSLATPTLPILPLLTTGKLPTVSPIDAAPTIVTTLQPSTSILSAIDGNTLYSAPKENTIITSSKLTPVPPTSQNHGTTKSQSGATANTAASMAKEQPKKVTGEGNAKSVPSSGSKTQGKDGKTPTQSSSSKEPREKSPLQLAQDIIDSFEKKSSAKKVADTSSGNSNKEKPASGTNTSSMKEIIILEEKVKEKPVSTKVEKASKDGNNKAEGKSSDATNASKPAIASSSSIDPKADTGNSVESNKNSSRESPMKPTVTTEVVQLDDKSKIPVDSSSKPPATFAGVTFSLTTPVNSIVHTAAQQLQGAAHQQQLSDTIITSQTSVMNTTPQLIFKDGLQLATDQGLTLTTSMSTPIPTISLSAMGNQIIQTSGAPVPCSSTFTSAGGLSTFTHAGTNQIILQQQPQQTQDQGNGANTFLTTSTGPGNQPLRYPILQTIQPLFLNSAGHAGGPLIFSQPQSQDPNQTNHQITQQSFIYDQNGTPTATIDGVGAFQSMLQPTTTTMVLDPSFSAGNPNMAGGKKKKKRLSKKQQQQQAQLQLQQQFILQQLQQQQQAAAAAATIPLTIFPQSFNLGPQGFSLQPTMNFFPTPTILTLPNLILNPADGTLFIQPSTPLQTTTTTQMPQTTMKLGQFPITTTTVQQNPQNIAPKKDGSNTIIQIQNEPLKQATTPGLDPGSDDSRQNPTPDSSTNDLQLGLINVATGPQPQTNTITLNIPAPTTTTVLQQSPSPVVSKKNSKSRTVSSSSTTVKRILPQKQILPKIDSTTPSTTENANC